MNEHNLQLHPDQVNPDPGMRGSLWLMTGAMVLIIGLKSHADPFAGFAWHYLGWPLLAASLFLAKNNSR